MKPYKRLELSDLYESEFKEEQLEESVNKTIIYVDPDLENISKRIQVKDGKLFTFGYSSIIGTGELTIKIQNYIYENLHKGQNFFFRATDNKNEIDVVTENPNLKSKNQGQGFYEKGLSVSEHFGYQKYFNYKYIYVVTGKIVGYGSDGEPLLQNVKVLSPLNKISSFKIKLKSLEKNNLKRLGISFEDYENIKNALIDKNIEYKMIDDLKESVKYKYVVRNGKRVKRAYTDKKGYKIKTVNGKPTEVRMTSKELNKRKKGAKKAARKPKKSSSIKKRIKSTKKHTW